MRLLPTSALRMRVLVGAAVASALAVFFACGSPGLTESQSCELRHGACVDPPAPGETPDCPVVKGVRYVAYLDSCFCCAPPEDAGVVTITPPVEDTGAPTGDDDMDAASDASGDDADTDGATDASDAGAIQDAAEGG